MARILLAHTSFSIGGKTVIPSFFESLLDVLKREGNDVLHITMNDFVFNPWRGADLEGFIDRDKFSERIRAFKPDIVLAANNAVCPEILEVTDCPIAVWTMDSPLFYPDTIDIAKYAERYYFFCATQDILKAAVKKYEMIQKNHFIELNFATDLQAETRDQDKNISFIGSNWSASYPLKSTIQRLLADDALAEKWHALYRYVLEHPYLDLQSAASEVDFPIEKLPSITSVDILNLSSANKRLQTLAQLAEIDGLYLYGPSNWINTLDFSYNIFKAHQKTSIFSKKDTQNLYNESKISLSIAHDQTRDALPWRVRDIMATNSVLLTDRRANLDHFFGDLDLPVYESAAEARDLVRKLLDNPDMCRDISARSREAIDKGHRFEHRLKVIEESMPSIKLLGNTMKGSYDTVTPQEVDRPVYSAYKRALTSSMNKSAVILLPMAVKIAKTLRFKPSDELKNRLRDML